MRVSVKWYLAGLLASLGLLAIAYFYFQQNQGLIPCPLCMFQRAALVAIAIVCLIGLLHRPGLKAHKIYSLLIGLSALVGAGVAGRQTWLQHLPADQVPECGFDPIYRWSQGGDDYGFLQMLATTLRGSGDCATVDWQWMSLSMAEWMLVIFAVMLVIAVVLFFKPPRKA